MNGYLIFIIAVLAGSYLLDTVLSILNLRSLSADLPAEFHDMYDAAGTENPSGISRNNALGMVESTVLLIATMVFILIGGFDYIDRIAARPGGRNCFRAAV